MLFWHRKVWLGNGDKLGQSVYWDTKEKKAYIGESSKLISVKKSKNNGLYAGIIIVVLTGLIGILKLSGFHIRSSDSNDFWTAMLTLIYSAIAIYLMNRFFYRRHAKYTETTLKQARAVINTHPCSHAGWKDLFIFVPIMFLMTGGSAIAILFAAIDEVVVVLR
ncbi:MAG: hypothetical protein ABF804_00520 [Liquorilactobacillus ghanensis]|jgi:hypothetical protein|uniref:Uncharacterized protein n=1 Tax=Liquorilactobacillus ghanensis DSM 18630 TaxID=1423750 RepID=A0A0R1VIH0_9LACO|nr:hypothetical protein [Liquorilactobacillus ghanensis]KRM05616.1 hypothetical protein FC89_GL001320 [Liquorilactobacillus ghanensis DSM 18630]